MGLDLTFYEIKKKDKKNKNDKEKKYIKDLMNYCMAMELNIVTKENFYTI